MTRTAGSYAVALLAVAVVAWLTATLLPLLGLASAALLFLLPVLLAAMRGVGPGLTAALAATAAYNYFLIEPRYTFRVHQLDSLVSVFVLGAVALVTSRLAARLLARETEANARAEASAEAAQLSAILAAGPADEALAAGIAFVAARHGPVQLIDGAIPGEAGSAFSSLDLAAAAWALHNGDMTGHGTETMAAADWTFVPLVAKSRGDMAVAALARPAGGELRSAGELARIQGLAGLLGQGRDRVHLDRAREERALIEQSDRLRRTFLASLAHDFRTPLTVITGQLEPLARRDPAARDALAAARRLDRTMSDLLGAARLEEGSLVAAAENVDLVDTVSATCDGLILPPGVRLDRRIGADLPFVRADPVLLPHVLANLIDNALRHARSAVTVGATVAGGRVTVTIDDDGLGVPEAERALMFDRFRRLAGSDRTAGSGLGLAIVKGFTDAMGGEVAVSDAPCGGARFVLVLPLAGDGAP